jgi:glyoxylase-like metal-dependent hydrolase (beta-lactamase superfamily II)
MMIQVMIFLALGIVPGWAQPQKAAPAKPAPPDSPRLYVFDCGAINGLNTETFGFKKEQLAESNFVVVCYLVAHPKGTVMFDVGVIADDQFQDGRPVKQGVSTVIRPLLPQLAALGYRPENITYFAASHYHSDHMANANAFAGSTWLVQKAERDAMFSDKAIGITDPAHYAKLKDAKAKILNNEDFDVFGDGTVVVKSAPGHTPGHQMLYVKLKKYGPVLLSGDLYHYPEEGPARKTPTFEFNREMSLASREKVDAFVKQSKAQLWIAHDKPTHDKIPKAPAYLD